MIAPAKTNILELLKQLPPPWEADPEEIAAVASRVGFPIVYQVEDDPGWHAVLDLENGLSRDKPSERRYEQLKRTMDVIAFIAPRTVGVTLQEVHEEAHPEVCERTIRRDLGLLLELGMIVKEHANGIVRYYWNDRSVRGVVLRHVARSQEMVF